MSAEYYLKHSSAAWYDNHILFLDRLLFCYSSRTENSVTGRETLQEGSSANNTLRWILDYSGTVEEETRIPPCFDLPTLEGATKYVFGSVIVGPSQTATHCRCVLAESVHTLVSP